MHWSLPFIKSGQEFFAVSLASLGRREIFTNRYDECRKLLPCQNPRPPGRSSTIKYSSIPNHERILYLLYCQEISDMMMIKSFIAVFSLLDLLAASPVPSTHEVHERRDTLHSSWTKRHRVESHKLLPMRVGLTQSNLENGYDLLMDV